MIYVRMHVDASAHTRAHTRSAARSDTAHVAIACRATCIQHSAGREQLWGVVRQLIRKMFCTTNIAVCTLPPP